VPKRRHFCISLLSQSSEEPHKLAKLIKICHVWFLARFIRYGTQVSHFSKKVTLKCYCVRFFFYPANLYLRKFIVLALGLLFVSSITSWFSNLSHLHVNFFCMNIYFRLFYIFDIISLHNSYGLTFRHVLTCIIRTYSTRLSIISFLWMPNMTLL